MAKKSSFFSKITGSSSNDQYDEFFDDAPVQRSADTVSVNARDNTWAPEDSAGGELAVDVYQTPDAIVVKALVAGVQPGSIDISLTREMLTISGTREDEREVQDEGYFQRELYWGSFSRTILLPEEIDVDLAEATEKHGILMIRLPKINKKRQTKLKVRSR
ncbi:MAG: heat shock protein Hsp20, family protein [Candidatus Kaiserbacteria bacterium]|nr:heat shock protein Hsp20, family protein [Candidatus Kaiserbacteria bacterium]